MHRKRARAFMNRSSTVTRSVFACDRLDSRTLFNLSKPHPISTIAFVTLFVLMLPVLIPYGMVSELVSRRRRDRDAAKSACTKCGAVLGREAVERSNVYWREYGLRSQRLYPSMRINLIRSNSAICIGCGTAHKYNESTRTFQATELRPLPEVVNSEDS